MPEKPRPEQLPKETEKQLEKVLLYQPDVLLNANFEDPSTLSAVESLAAMFTTGVNRVALLDENFYRKNFKDVMGMGFGKADIALEVITGASPREGLHHRFSRDLDETPRVHRFVLDTTSGTVRPQMEGIRDLPKHNWPGKAQEVLEEMEEFLARNPEKKWFPAFAEHLEWLSRNVVSFNLAEFKKLVPYDLNIPKEYSSLLVVDTSKTDSDVHPLQRSHLIGQSMTIKAMDTGYVHVDCLSGCGAEIPSVPLKGNGNEGIIVVGSHCDSCSNEYKPKFPNTTLKKFLSTVKM